MIYANNWREFQHYGQRRPPWIKLYRSLLDDVVYQRLPVASKALAPMLWLLASEHIEGGFTDNMSDLAYRLRMTESDLLVAIKPLIDNGFFSTDSTMLASCYQDARPETERETETETKKKRSSKKELPSPPEEYLGHLETICRDWPRKTSYKEKRADVTILSRPADLWQRILKFCPGEDPKLPINCAIRYLDDLDQRPRDYEGLIPNVCAMTNFFGEKALWKNMIDKVHQ